MSERGWIRARAEHREALARFASAVAAVPDRAWALPTAEGKWSPAAIALHVVRAYELGDVAMHGGPGMRLRVRPWQAWMLRRLVLPYVLATGRFPRGAEAPAEVVPDLGEASQLNATAASRRLDVAAAAALESIVSAGQRPRPPRARHAYFGELSPLATLRLLSAHTRHHASALRRRFNAGHAV